MLAQAPKHHAPQSQTRLGNSGFETRATAIEFQNMRTARSIAVLLFAVVAACGGGGTDKKDPTSPVTPTTPTTPTTPQPGPPALIVVQTGDAQLSEPGRSVAIRPSVIIKDAAGLAVPNASVIFVVDSGGGSVTGASVTSANDGSATITDWKLGKEPGRNVLRVTAGNAPSARITATTSWTGVTAPLGNVGATGGTIAFARPGSLLDGLALVIPPNALATATNFSAVVASSATVAAMRASTSVVQSQSATPSVSAYASLANVSKYSLSQSLAQAIAFSHISVPLAIPASMLAVTPIITIVSDGLPTANEDVLIKLPIPRRHQCEHYRRNRRRDWCTNRLPVSHCKWIPRRSPSTRADWMLRYIDWKIQIMSWVRENFRWLFSPAAKRLPCDSCIQRRSAPRSCRHATHGVRTIIRQLSSTRIPPAWC